MRLIDADKLKKAFCSHCDGDEPCTEPCIDIGLIETAPTIDAVEVVHCRECKWLHIVNDNILYGFCTKGHAMFYPFQLDTRDFFCADGERRDTCSSQDS